MSQKVVEGSPLQILALALFLGLFLAWERAPFLLFLAGLFFWRAPKRRLGLLVLGLSFAYGSQSFEFRSPFADLSFPLRTEAVVRLLSPTLKREGFSYALAEIETLAQRREKTRVQTELYFKGGQEFGSGSLLLIEGVFKPLKERLNPFSYSFVRVKQSRGLFFRAYVKRAKLLSQSPSWLERLRNKLFRFAEGLSPQAQGLFEALILGSRFHLPAGLQEKFETQGTFHLLAISGMHLGLLLSWSWLMVKLFLRLWPSLLLFLPEKLLVFLVSSPLLVSYSLLSGPTPSALRAVVMFGLFTMNLILYREGRGLDLLALTVLLILLKQPATVGSLSFRLSVSATAAILIAARLRKKLPGTSGCWRYPFNVFYFSLAASLATAPWILSLKGQMPLLCPFYNLLSVPLFGLSILPLEFLSALLALIKSAWGASVAELAARMVSLIPRGPSLFLNPPYPLGAFFVAFLPGLSLLFWPSRKTASLAFGLCLFLHFFFWSFPRSFFILFDVGHGNAALLKTKEAAFLFDAGPKFGSYDAGKFVLAPALRKLGVKRLESVIISHPQADHLGGLAYLKRHLFIKEVISGFQLGPGSLWLQRPTWMSQGGVLFSFYPGRGDPNQASLVSRVCFSEFCFLLPGDIGFKRERTLVRSHLPLKATVLILPHHGSRTAGSLPFLKAVSPSLVLSSSGRTYHPAPQTLRRLKSLNLPHLGTKEEGAISLILGPRIFLCTEKRRRQEAWLKRALWPYVASGCETWKP